MDSSIILLLLIVIIFLIYNSSNKIYYQLPRRPVQPVYINRYPTFHGGHRRRHHNKPIKDHIMPHNKLIGGNPATWGPSL